MAYFCNEDIFGVRLLGREVVRVRGHIWEQGRMEIKAPGARMLGSGGFWRQGPLVRVSEATLLQRAAIVLGWVRSGGGKTQKHLRERAFRHQAVWGRGSPYRRELPPPPRSPPRRPDSGSRIPNPQPHFCPRPVRPPLLPGGSPRGRAAARARRGAAAAGGGRGRGGAGRGGGAVRQRRAP